MILGVNTCAHVLAVYHANTRVDTPGFMALPRSGTNMVLVISSPKPWVLAIHDKHILSFVGLCEMQVAKTPQLQEFATNILPNPKVPGVPQKRHKQYPPIPNVLTPNIIGSQHVCVVVTLLICFTKKK